MADKIEKPKSKEPSGASEITYSPRDPAAPICTSVDGVPFRAGVPVLTAHKMTQLHATERVLPTGQVGKDYSERKVPLADVLRGNPDFIVDGVQAERIAGTAKIPQTPDAYRGWALAWIDKAVNLQELDIRWKAEQELRESCGIDANDIAQLAPFIEYRRRRLGASSAAA